MRAAARCEIAGVEKPPAATAAADLRNARRSNRIVCRYGSAGPRLDGRAATAVHRASSAIATKTTSNGCTVTKGTWLIGAILDEHSWALAKAGKLNGFSMQGVARRRHPVKE